jgi:hypothetical protein
LDSIYLDERVISNSKKASGIRKSTIMNIYDATIFRYSPDFLKRYIYNDGAWLLKTYIPDRQVISNNNVGNSVKTSQIIFNDKALTLSDVAFANRVMTDKNTVGGQCIFKFYRLNGSHPPYLLNEKLEYEKMNDDNGNIRQSKASLRITKIFLDELKTLGVFDNSMIFVIGDHGLTSGSEHIRENANPLFLVKTFNGTEQMVTSYIPVSLSDINNTIFSELGFLDNLNGKSVFDFKNMDSRERRFLYYTWQNTWDLDYLPSIKEYVISGPVWEEKSWRSTGHVFVSEFAEKPLTEWLDGFSSSEGTQENNWRWCSAEGTIVINNTSNSDRKYIISAMFYTGYPDESYLTIESTLLNDTVKINNSGYSYTKEIIVQPGSHGIIFRCNAKRVEAINDLRFLVFNMTNFQIQEVK